MTAVATPRTAAVERFVGAWRAAGTQPGPQWLQQLRSGALEQFEVLGFPGPRDEAWRFTSVAPIVETPFDAAAPAAVTADALRPFLVGKGAARHALVFVNGRFAPKLSAPGRLPAGVTVTSLSAAFTSHADLVRAHLGRHTSSARHAFAALNAAFLTDGALIHVGAGIELDEPLQLLFVTAAGAARPAVHPRALIVVERAARATVVETYAGLDPSAVSLTNAVTELVVNDGARVDHYRIQREAPAAYHVGVTHSHQGRDATLHSTTVAFGAALARHDITAVLDGQGANLNLNGLSVAAGHQHLDHHTTIDHAQPHGESHELFNGVFDGRARGVFTGRIIVRPGAQRTDSKQTNNNLLLSGDARADSQPQLEIYADDVKCTHGSTTGPLDPGALFYLKSRGLDPRAATGMLTYGFGAEIVSRIAVEGVRAEVDRLLRERVAEAVR